MHEAGVAGDQRGKARLRRAHGPARRSIDGVCSGAGEPDAISPFIDFVSQLDLVDHSQGLFEAMGETSGRGVIEANCDGTYRG